MPIVFRRRRHSPELISLIFSGDFLLIVLIMAVGSNRDCKSKTFLRFYFGYGDFGQSQIGAGIKLILYLSLHTP